MESIEREVNLLSNGLRERERERDKYSDMLMKGDN